MYSGDKIMYDKWVRRTWVTKCSDPTEVVEWRFGKQGAILEFQDVYKGSGIFEYVPDDQCRAIHCALESLWHEKAEREIMAKYQGHVRGD